MKKSVLLKKPAEKSRYRPEKRADRAQKEPDGRKHPINWIRNRKRFSIAYDTSQFSMNLLRGKRSFHFGLIVPDQIEAIPGNSADAVQNKDSLHTAIQNYIAAMKFGRNTVFNDSFVPARKKKRIHTVALRFQFDGRTVF